jgi:hypothetical protein
MPLLREVRQLILPTCRSPVPPQPASYQGSHQELPGARQLLGLYRIWAPSCRSSERYGATKMNGTGVPADTEGRTGRRTAGAAAQSRAQWRSHPVSHDNGRRRHSPCKVRHSGFSNRARKFRYEGPAKRHQILRSHNLPTARSDSLRHINLSAAPAGPRAARTLAAAAPTIATTALIAMPQCAKLWRALRCSCWLPLLPARPHARTSGCSSSSRPMCQGA